jgi:hypothetical protein
MAEEFKKPKGLLDTSSASVLMIKSNEIEVERLTLIQDLAGEDIDYKALLNDDPTGHIFLETYYQNALIATNFDQAIYGAPAIVLNPKLFDKAWAVKRAMAEFEKALNEYTSEHEGDEDEFEAEDNSTS